MSDAAAPVFSCGSRWLVIKTANSKNMRTCKLLNSGSLTHLTVNSRMAALTGWANKCAFGVFCINFRGNISCLLGVAYISFAISRAAKASHVLPQDCPSDLVRPESSTRAAENESCQSHLHRSSFVAVRHKLYCSISYKYHIATFLKAYATTTHAASRTATSPSVSKPKSTEHPLLRPIRKRRAGCTLPQQSSGRSRPILRILWR